VPRRARRPLRPLRGLALGLALALAPGVGARVLVVGVDGGSWNALDPLLAAGELPALASLVARGATAELETVEPVISPVVWTSIATGRSPRAHGVSGFLTSRRQLRVPTAFERLAAAGVRVGLYEWLVTWPPQALPAGFVIPGWLRRDGATWPAEVFARAGVAPFVVRYDAVYSREAHVAGIREELALRAPAWLALARAYDVEVGALTFYAVDRTSHRFWREAYADGDRAAPPAAGSLLREVLVGFDRALGQLAASLGPEDALLVVSDHGFRAAASERHVFAGRTREHLARAGLDPARDRFTLDREWGAIVARVHPGSFEAREPVLERLAAFLESARGPSGEPLLDVQVLDAAPRPPGRERGLVERAWQAGFRLAARWLYGARFEEPAHAFVVARFDGDALDRLWPDAEVTLAGAPLRVDQLAFREEFTGEHDETAILVAAGGPIAARARRDRLSVLDVAPLLLYLAGQPIPDDLEGELPRAWIRPDALAARAPRAIAAELAPRLPPEAELGAGSPELDDEALRDRLRTLGYVE
jgi:arylsulfatase A-like enzyme